MMTRNMRVSTHSNSVHFKLSATFLRQCIRIESISYGVYHFFAPIALYRFSISGRIPAGSNPSAGSVIRTPRSF